jgi:hypothetical protein
MDTINQNITEKIILISISNAAYFKYLIKNATSIKQFNWFFIKKSSDLTKIKQIANSLYELFLIQYLIKKLRLSHYNIYI